ncbi:alginate lyase family protein [Streptomyces sp. Qhu-G9]|uniref:alginate lyase family protein n=1 Tax=Streptomyces sp. Qhu-G9 TaxID=3452799 RepID=UPI0022AC867C|nr:alginate lyase family protein [Streptomyces aurantiacus]WAU84588.1 alginate lyase family protein [Streptomyces aurantiacus]
MAEHNKHRVGRRGVLRIAGGVAAAGAVGGLAVSLGGRDSADAAQSGAVAGPGPRPAAAKREFAHPGMLHNPGDLHRAEVRVAAGRDPWLAGWRRLTANRHSASTWKPNPRATIVRGGAGQNYGVLYNDVHAAYQNALRWKIAGTRDNAGAAVAILNAWSAELTAVTGNSDRFLASGIYGYQFANAAELVRDHPGFDLARFQKMMRTVFHPLNEDFLKRHNGAVITNYWANWDLCNVASIMAIGILCDDTALFDRAVTYFRTGPGNGSIKNATPFVYEDEGLAQWQESGRDQGHTVMGMGLIGAICEMAWNQGVDLYGYDGNRLMKGAEYVARYNLGGDVPFTRYSWRNGTRGAHQQQTVISDIGRGQIRPVWELLHNHYARRRRLSVPHISAMAEKVRAEGGGGDYGPNSGGFDQLGFGTLLYSK